MVFKFGVDFSFIRILRDYFSQDFFFNIFLRKLNDFSFAHILNFNHRVARSRQLAISGKSVDMTISLVEEFSTCRGFRSARFCAARRSGYILIAYLSGDTARTRTTTR